MILISTEIDFKSRKLYKAKVDWRHVCIFISFSFSFCLSFFFPLFSYFLPLYFLSLFLSSFFFSLLPICFFSRSFSFILFYPFLPLLFIFLIFIELPETTVTKLLIILGIQCSSTKLFTSYIFLPSTFIFSLLLFSLPLWQGIFHCVYSTFTEWVSCISLLSPSAPITHSVWPLHLNLVIVFSSLSKLNSIYYASNLSTLWQNQLSCHSFLFSLDIAPRAFFSKE